MADGVPSTSGIGTGAAQIFSTQKAEAADLRRQAEQKARQQKREASIAEIKGELPEFEDTEGWTTRDQEMLLDDYKRLVEKYDGNWEKVFTDPKFRAEYNNDIINYKSKVRKSTALKDMMGPIVELYEKHPEKYTDEQKEYLDEIITSPGYGIDEGEIDINYLSRFKQELPNPITHILDSVDPENFLDVSSYKSETADEEEGLINIKSGSSTKVNRDQWKTAMRDFMEADKETQDAILETFFPEKESWSDVTDQEKEMVAGRVSNQYTKEKTDYRTGIKGLPGGGGDDLEFNPDNIVTEPYEISSVFEGWFSPEVTKEWEVQTSYPTGFVGGETIPMSTNVVALDTESEDSIDNADPSVFKYGTPAYVNGELMVFGIGKVGEDKNVRIMRPFSEVEGLFREKGYDVDAIKKNLKLNTLPD